MSVGGNHVASDGLGTVLFAGVLLAAALASGLRRPALPVRSIAIGAAGGCVLVALWAFDRQVPLAAASKPVADWALGIAIVAVAEEALLRGVLFDALLAWSGTLGALVVTSAAFAVIHVPLYGWGAVPLDLAVGVWLGGLRLVTGGWAAPAVAHTFADLAAGWL
jgi:membrane protease YdiL (CAAX protease family)